MYVCIDIYTHTNTHTRSVRAINFLNNNLDDEGAHIVAKALREAASSGMYTFRSTYAYIHTRMLPCTLKALTEAAPLVRTHSDMCMHTYTHAWM
jgi:hypothetical protein